MRIFTVFSNYCYVLLNKLGRRFYFCLTVFLVQFACKIARNRWEMHKAFTQHEYQVRYKIIAKLKKKKKKQRQQQNARCMRSIGNQWNLELKFRQHKLKKREAEGYCTETFRLMIIWSRTTLRRFTNKQSPSEESAPETFVGMKDDKRDHQDSKVLSMCFRIWMSVAHPLSL